MTRKKKCLMAWAVLYVACTVWGFIPEPQGALYGLLFLTSLGFFIPPAILMYDAVKRQDLFLIRLLRNLSLGSLTATVLAVILNFMTVNASAAAGKVLYWLLIIVSTPMVCSQVWVVSLFCWACLMMVGIRHSRKK